MKKTVHCSDSVTADKAMKQSMTSDKVTEQFTVSHVATKVSQHQFPITQNQFYVSNYPSSFSQLNDHSQQCPSFKVPMANIQNHQPLHHSLHPTTPFLSYPHVNYPINNFAALNSSLHNPKVIHMLNTSPSGNATLSRNALHFAQPLFNIGTSTSSSLSLMNSSCYQFTDNLVTGDGYKPSEDKSPPKTKDTLKKTPTVVDLTSEPKKILLFPYLTHNQ